MHIKQSEYAISNFVKPKITMLYLLSQVFLLITFLRNQLFDKGYLKQTTFDLPIICVGNLSVGGTGKTPCTEYLVRLLQKKNKLAILSRGYGRKTKGFILGEKTKHNAFDLGDEPFQYLCKYDKNINVCVGENRVNAVKQIQQTIPQTEIVLLDDAFQHRHIKAGFYILLTDFSKLFTKDNLLPAGRLRESRFGAKRANAIVVTKCPNVLMNETKVEITKKIHQYAPDVPVFFAKINYGNFINFFGVESKPKSKIILLTGIANSAPLVAYLKQNHFEIVKHFSFKDHYFFSKQDIEQFLSFTDENLSIVTTEKDFVRLVSADLVKLFDKTTPFYLPIEMDFLENGRNFDELILSYILQH